MLMASYELFLIDENKGTGVAKKFNSWLNELNDDSSGLAKLTTMDDTSSDKVRTVLLLSNGQETLQTVNVDSTNTTLYQYGQPRTSQTFSIGDGTVPVNTAWSPLLSRIGLTVSKPKGIHSGLLGAFASEISGYLRDGRQLTAKAVTPLAKTTFLMAEAVAPPAALNIALKGHI